jgi:aryl-alcohol dehydrogenase-like predicted oxidoreductase
MTDVNMALGTMHFGTRVDDADAFALLDRFVDAGGTILDTADCYAFWADPSRQGGQSEAVIGRWLDRRPGRRDSVFLGTKVGAEPLLDHAWPDRRHGLSATRVTKGIEGSLRRLGTDRVDLYWAHLEDRDVALEETVEAMAGLVDAGKAARLGASNHPVWRVERARQIAAGHGWEPYTAVQLSYSYLQPRPLAPIDGQDHRFGMGGAEAVDYAASDPELWLWAYSPLLRGSYARPDRPFAEAYNHPGTTRRLAVLGEVAEEIGATRNQIVLSWLAGGEPAITPIVGVSSAAQLDEAIEGVSIEITDEQRRRLDAAS